MLKNKKLTKKDLCDKWLTNKTINPETSRKIKENGDVYKKLEKLCSLNQKEICDRWLANKTINPETLRKIKENGDIYKKLEKKCLVKSESKSESFKTAPSIPSSFENKKQKAATKIQDTFKKLKNKNQNRKDLIRILSREKLRRLDAVKSYKQRLMLEKIRFRRAYTDSPKKIAIMEKQIEKTNKQIEFYMKQANFITDKLTAYKIPILTNIKDSNRRLRIVQNIYIELIKKINNNRITWSKAIESYNNIINSDRETLQKTDDPKERAYLEERILTTTKIIDIYIRKMNFITEQIDELSKIETETKNFVNKFSKNERLFNKLSTIESNNEREIRFSNMMIRILENKTKQTTNPIKRNYNRALIFEYNNYIQYIEMIKHNINQIKFVIIKSTNVINSPPNIKKKKNSFELKLEQREISIKERAAIVEQQKIYVEQLLKYLDGFPRNNEIFNKYITYNALYNQALEERAANTVGITGRLFKTKETQREMNYKYEIANINSKAYYANMKLFKNLYEDKKTFIKNHYAKIMNQPSVAKMKETEQQLKITDGSLINSLYIIPSSFDEKESINEAKRISDLKKNEEKEKERLEKERIANDLLMKKARNDYKDARIRSREANQRLLSDLINKQRIRSREVN